MYQSHYKIESDTPKSRRTIPLLLVNRGQENLENCSKWIKYSKISII